MNITSPFSIGDIIEFDIGTYTKVGMILGLCNIGNDCEVSILQHNGRIRKRILKHDVGDGYISRLYHYSGVDYPVKVWNAWKNSRT